VCSGRVRRSFVLGGWGKKNRLPDLKETKKKRKRGVRQVGTHAGAGANKTREGKGGERRAHSEKGKKKKRGFFTISEEGCRPKRKKKQKRGGHQHWGRRKREVLGD